MTKLEQLRAQVAAKLELDKQNISEQMEISRLTAKLSILNNPAMETSRVNLAITSETTNKLKSLIMQCETIISSMPIYSSKTRETRKWNPTAQYGMGNHIQLLTSLLSGINYAATDHKVMMLAATGLSEDLIEQTLEAFGSTAYYSNNYATVIAETPCNLSKLQDCIALIEDSLDLTLDKSKLTLPTMSARFELARVVAERKEAELALAQATPTVAI